MQQVLRCLDGVKSDALKSDVDRRLAQFAALGRKSSEDIFKELCFCLMTANFTAERGWKIQKSIGNGFLTLSEKQLAARLKKEGHRFPNTRAKYISEAQKHAKTLKKTIKGFERSGDAAGMRDWLVKNIKGLGYKEASHFLRNIGYLDYAIIDFHIVDFLVKHDRTERPKTITPKAYLMFEDRLRRVADASGMSLGELDLYLWYCETGKVLK